jgi:hypothetical protein
LPFLIFFLQCLNSFERFTLAFSLCPSCDIEKQVEKLKKCREILRENRSIQICAEIVTAESIAYDECRRPRRSAPRRIGDFQKNTPAAVPWRGPEAVVIRK